jgi:N-acylneuraminate cytidylyltransferase
VDRVVVSTDDPEIGDVAAHYGAEVVWRPAEISGDVAPSEAALIHVLEGLKNREGTDPEVLVFLQATSPIRTAREVDGAVQRLIEEELDSLFSASPAHGFVWERCGESVKPLTYDYRHRPMRQETGERLVENGSIYVLRPRVLMEGGSRLGGKIGIYHMGFLEAIQIDTAEDLAVAEWVLACRRSIDETTACDPSRCQGEPV